jgi:O-antigen/teichoic acid export membrane protein
MSKVAFGAAALTVANIARVIVLALAVPLVARFITPAEFGLVAVATPFLTIVMVFADAGIGMSLLRSKPELEDLWSTAFWFTLLVGVALSGLVLAAGPIAAWVFDEPILLRILAALALVPLMQGLAAIPYARVYQREKLVYLAAAESLGTFAGAAIAIALAVAGSGVWALIAQQLSTTLVRLIGVVIISDFVPKARFNMGLLEGHVRFGRDMIGFKLIDFFATSADRLVIGKILGVESAGYFAMATQIVRLPRLLLLGPINRAVYPRLIRVGEDRAELRKIFLACTRILGAVIFSSMAFAAAESHALFTILLSDRWIPAATLFSLLVPVNAVMAVTSLNGTVLMAINRTDVQILSAAEYTSLRFAILCATAWGGLEALALGLNASFALYFYRFAKLFLATIDCTFSKFLGALGRPAAIAALFAGLHTGIIWWLDPRLELRLFIGVVLLLACWSTMFLTMRSTFLVDLKVLRRTFKDDPAPHR